MSTRASELLVAFCVGLVIGLGILMAYFIQKDSRIVKELRVTEVTMKERQLSPNVSELYIVWVVCDNNNFCFNMEGKQVPIGYKLR